MNAIMGYVEARDFLPGIVNRLQFGDYTAYGELMDVLLVRKSWYTNDMNQAITVGMLSGLHCPSCRRPIVPRVPRDQSRFWETRCSSKVVSGAVFYLLPGSPDVPQNGVVCVIRQPSVPQFPVGILTLLQKTARVVPHRRANSVLSTVGKLKPDAQPVQTHARVMNEERLLFIKQWLEGKINEEIVKPAFVDAWLSPIHLVAKLDKSHNRIPGKYRITLDCSQMNSQFEQYPCAIPSLPLTAARLAQYDVKAVIDISDGFFGIIMICIRLNLEIYIRAIH